MNPIGKREQAADAEKERIKVPSQQQAQTIVSKLKRQGNYKGKRPVLARVNPSSRAPRKLNPRQERFVREYLKDMSPADAYVRAGYECESRQSAYTLACRLMKNPMVLEAIDQCQAGILNDLEMDVKWTILRFKHVYLTAYAKGDLANACRALENIGRHLGLYELDNKQQMKEYTQADLDRLKQELTEAGFSFERINFPTAKRIMVESSDFAKTREPNENGSETNGDTR